MVFSQFTTMLDIVEAVLNEEGIPCTRIDGSMSLKKRQMAISEFSRLDGGPVVLLVSLKSGGQGINLARGNLVYMMDLWWNAAAESQAQDRYAFQVTSRASVQKPSPSDVRLFLQGVQDRASPPSKGRSLPYAR